MSHTQAVDLNAMWRTEQVLLIEGRWTELRRLLRRMLRDNPDDHLALSDLAMSYCETGESDKAMKFVSRAIASAPSCPYVNWTLACILDQAGRQEEAIAVWKHLMRRGVHSIAYGACGEGIRSARSLVNDCRLRVALCLWDLKRSQEAWRYFRSHQSHRAPGIPSLWRMKELNEIEREWRQEPDGL